MTKIIASAVAFALLSGSAFAAGSISGTIRSFDQNARVIVLDDGSSARVPLHVGIPANLDAGSYAKIEFDAKDGKANKVFSDSLLAR